MKFCNRKYMFVVVSTSLGSGFQHGFHAGVLNVAAKTIKEWIKDNIHHRIQRIPSEKETTMIWLTAVSIFPFGGMLGSLMTAHFARRFGHKGGLIWNNFIMFLAALFLCTAKFAQLIEVFIIGRFLIGINVGLNMGLCPIYLAEIAPRSLRGTTAACYSFFYAVSIFISQFCGLDVALGNKEYWPFIFGVSTIPAVFQLLALLYCPESPRFLLVTLEDEDGAEKSLIWFRNTTNVTQELEMIREHRQILEQLPKVTVKTMFTDKFYRMPWIICIMTVLSQQCCGIDFIIYFSTTMLREVGLQLKWAQYATLIMGILLVLVTLMCVVSIDNAGRRKLLLISFCGMAIDTIFIIIALRLSKNAIVKEYMKYGTTVAFVVFVAWYAMGTGTIPWIITVELFHHTARPLAVSMTIPINWLANFIISVDFLYVKDQLGADVFWIFIVLDLILFLFVYVFLPETSGKTSKQIITMFYNLKEDLDLQREFSTVF